MAKQRYREQSTCSRFHRIKRTLRSNEHHAHQIIWDEINSCSEEQLPKLVKKLNTLREFIKDPIIIVNGEAMLTSEGEAS